MDTLFHDDRYDATSGGDFNPSGPDSPLVTFRSHKFATGDLH